MCASVYGDKYPYFMIFMRRFLGSSIPDLHELFGYDPLCTVVKNVENVLQTSFCRREGKTRLRRVLGALVFREHTFSTCLNDASKKWFNSINRVSDWLWPRDPGNPSKWQDVHGFQG